MKGRVRQIQKNTYYKVQFASTILRLEIYKKSCAKGYIDSTGSVWSIQIGEFRNSNANVHKETEVYADK